MKTKQNELLEMKLNNNPDLMEMITNPKHTFTGQIVITLEPQGQHTNYMEDYQKAVRDIIRHMEMSSISDTSGGKFAVTVSVRLNEVV